MAYLARLASIIGAAALFAACGGSQSPIGASGAMAQSDANRFGHKAGIAEKVIYSFSGGSGSTADGVYPRAGLIEASGKLYGTTFEGGVYGLKRDFRGLGTVFSVTPDGTEAVLHRFKGTDGKYPLAGLLDVNDTLYGTTKGGGGGHGVIFSITPSVEQNVLYAFKRRSKGATLYAGLIAVNGTMYGTTAAGGSSNCGDKYGCGTVFKITPEGKENVLYRFRSNGDGVSPAADLVNINGTLYGTTEAGGEDYGIVFGIAPSGKETVLHRFTSGASDGAEPWAGLVNVNGTLYGTTFNGGAYYGGTIFSITPSGEETLLHSFGASGDGVYPEAGLINVNGILYGTTYAGGANNRGTVFSITPSGTETVLYSFGTNSGDGKGPVAAPIDVKGTLYGTTVFGGARNHGTVYSVTGI